MSKVDTTNTPSSRNDDRWGRMKAVVGAAMDVALAERAAFLEAACGDDHALLREARALLEAAATSSEALSEDGPPVREIVDAMHAPALAIGTTIGRYRIEHALGAGGMGTVFEALDTTLNRRVALKVLSVGVTSERARWRFQSEATILARLDHPGIAQVLETGVHHIPDGTLSVPFFAMAYVDQARTLDRYVRTEQPSLRTVLEMFAHVCDAIHHGHQKGVLHRDIKPSNILVDSKGHPRVIDFGVSRLIDASVGALATRAGEFVGTPAYMPPEAFEHGVQSLDTRADVYSLGVVLYELLSGQNPFARPDQTPLQIAAASAKTPPPLRDSRPDCRGEIEIIVARAIAREPKDRYQSAEQFAADLRRVLRHEPILARPTPILRQGLLFARRNRALVAAVSAVTLAVALGIAGLFAGLARAQSSERRAIREATRARQFSSFMTQMLRSSSPFPGESAGLGTLMNPDTSGASPWSSTARPGKAPTVGDLLAAAMEHVESAFPDDPSLQADIAATLTQTAHTISDTRSSGLSERTAILLERAYGRDDPRTLAARQLVYYHSLLKGAGNLDEMEHDLALIRQLPKDQMAPLLQVAWMNCQRAHAGRGTIGSFLPVLRDIRGQLDRLDTGDTGNKFSLDQHILLIETAEADPAKAIDGLREMLARAHGLDNGKGAYTLSILFEIQQLQRTAGDFRGAFETLERGSSVSAEIYGGMEQATYEWLSHLYMVAFQLHEYSRAEEAAREQVRGAQAMLGPHSLYTTKANGRLARALLQQGKRIPEAESAARSAVEGAPELLIAGDAWALYHEIIWAWSIRLKGDPARADAVIRSRMDIEERAGRTAVASWVEILRYTELAQCAMDLGERASDLKPRAQTIERLLQIAEGHAADLGAEWPAVQLVEAARGRWESLRAR